MEYKRINFVEEFAYRTKINYYTMELQRLKKERIPNKYPNEKIAQIDKRICDIEDEMNNLKNKMKEKDFAISDYYEVTMLINSLMGLLVFPKESEYTKIGGSFDNFKELKSVIDTPNSYFSSYKGEERICPKNVIRHMRNALSHNKIGICPLSINQVKHISHIVFYDIDIKKDNGEYNTSLVVSSKEVYKKIPLSDLEKIFSENILQKVKELKTTKPLSAKDFIDENAPVFCLVIPIEKLESVVMEICDGIIDAKDKNSVNQRKSRIH